jgi:hypothetical protein
MANQVIIDIVADTKKLTSGIDDANKELGGMSKGLKTAATAAAGLASAFVLKQGVSFLKDGIEEAKDAAAAMRAATATFGAGSKALEEITKDAEKFGKELAVDNDELIKLATQLGSRLPKSIQSSSVELVKIFKDVEAFTGGAVSAEGAGNKLAKAFADGTLKAGELQKIFPSLNASVYEQAEALSKAGKNQEAINLLTAEGAKKYGDAAAKNVDATQKFNVALDNFKETLGTKVLPFLEKGIDLLTRMLDAFDALPGPVQNVVVVLGAIVAIGGPLLGFLASAKTSLITLGIVSEGAALGTTAFSTALKAIPILAAIALIVLLIQNWDDVSAAAKKLWETVSKWWSKIYDDIKEFAGKAIDWLKDNWPKILAVLTGPFGLFAAFIITHKDEILKTLKDGWEEVKTTVTGLAEGLVRGVSSWFNALRDYLFGLFQKGKDTIFSVLEDGWNLVKDTVVNVVETIYVTLQTIWLKILLSITDFVTKIVTVGVDKFNELKDKTLAAFEKLKTGASQIWENIKNFITSAVDNIKDKFGEVYGKMVEVGKDIARGIGAGLTSMTGWFKGLLGDWIQRNIPDWAKTILKIQSPSKVFAGIGTDLVQGLAQGITGAQRITTPTRLNTIAPMSAPFNITINAGLGTDPVKLGREVQNALNKYGRLTAV